MSLSHTGNPAPGGPGPKTTRGTKTTLSGASLPRGLPGASPELSRDPPEIPDHFQGDHRRVQVASGRPQMESRRPKRSPKRPRRLREDPQEGPKRQKSRHSFWKTCIFSISACSVVTSCRTARKAPKIAPRRPKRPQRGPQDCPRGFQDGASGAQDGPRAPQEGPKRASSGQFDSPDGGG